MPAPQVVYHDLIDAMGIIESTRPAIGSAAWDGDWHQRSSGDRNDGVLITAPCAAARRLTVEFPGIPAQWLMIRARICAVLMTPLTAHAPIYGAACFFAGWRPLTSARSIDVRKRHPEQMAIMMHHEGSAKGIGGRATHLVLVIVLLDALTAGIADVAATGTTVDQNTGAGWQLLGTKPSTNFGFDLLNFYIAHDGSLPSLQKDTSRASQVAPAIVRVTRRSM